MQCGSTRRMLLFFEAVTVRPARFIKHARSALFEYRTPMLNIPNVDNFITICTLNSLVYFRARFIFIHVYKTNNRSHLFFGTLRKRSTRGNTLLREG